MKAPKAALVCVGSELLAGQVNTHQAWLSVRLRRAGFAVAGEESVPDDVRRVAAAMRRALRAADAVIVCGGLGPTFDDLTREAAAAATGRRLSFDRRLWARIAARFARYRAPIPEQNKRQAMVLAGAKVLGNDAGSAPGQLISWKGRSLVLLPGPPSELYPMFERRALPALVRAHARGVHPASFSARLSGVPESVAAERLDPLRARWKGVDFTILAGQGEVSFHACVLERTPARARACAARLRREVLDAVGGWAHGEGDDTLESALGERLKRRKLTLAVAESCTGGLLGGRLSAVAGSSAYFLGGVIAYSNEVKLRSLGVPRRVLARHGAVSAECADAMALGVKRALRADLAVSITGIAGPGGGTKDKPVGLVHLSAAGPGKALRRQRLLAYGPREQVRARAVSAALRLAYDAAA